MTSPIIDRFRHEPLESPERQIRLLSVLPSTFGDQARYSLKTHILGGSKTPHFYAISYEWGHAQPLHEIIIDDMKFLIRSNLKDCLQRFEHTYEGFHRPVWIDAICIDQTNMAERNAQVKIMGAIYSSAMLVIAWFGKHAPANGALTTSVCCLQDWQASEEYRSLSSVARRPTSSSSQQTAQPQLLSLAEPYGQMWSVLRQLCDLTYWSRLWIVQELVKAPELLLMWGDEQIAWNVLSTAFRTIQLNKLRIRTSQARFAPWDAIETTIPYQVWLQRDGARQELSLLELMEAYRQSDCSVAHDKAYALTGISTNSHLIQVEYEKSLPDLYVDLMQLVLDKRKCAHYSKLILNALDLDPTLSLVGTGATSLRGHYMECEAEWVGRVESSKSVSISSDSTGVGTETYELLVMANVLLTTEMIDSLSGWAQFMHRQFQEAFGTKYNDLIFFWLSSNRLGVALAAIPDGDSVYHLPPPDGSNEGLFMRMDESDDGFERYSPRVGIESTPLSSPRSTSTFFSDAEIELATRVWVSPPNKSTRQEPRDSNSQLRQIQIPLASLVAMTDLIDIEMDERRDEVTEMKTETRQVRSDVPRRRSTRDSASISDVIDQAMQRASTWPTQTAGHAFIDALARELRHKLFISEDSPLNSPD